MQKQLTPRRLTVRSTVATLLLVALKTGTAVPAPMAVNVEPSTSPSTILPAHRRHKLASQSGGVRAGLSRVRMQPAIRSGVRVLQLLLLDAALDCLAPPSSRSLTLMQTAAEVPDPSQSGEGDDPEPPAHRDAARRRSSLFRPSTTAAMVGLMVGAYAAELRYPRLMASGARIASALERGEWYRLASSIVLHADPIHLLRTCAFGLVRLLPPAVAIFGSAQALLLFFLSGVLANAAAWRFALLLGSARDAPALGASAALLGLDGALLGYELRDGGRRPSGQREYRLQMALRRGAFTAALASPRPWLRGSERGGAVAVDHVAHAAGYACGLVGGWLLGPRMQVALWRWHDHLFTLMSADVAAECGATSVVAERAMLDYLSALPSGRRADALRSWQLGPPPPTLGPVPKTEAWPTVFEGLKAFVADALPKPSTPPTPPTPPASPKASKASKAPPKAPPKTTLLATVECDAADAADVPSEVELRRRRRRERERERLRAVAEERVWKHFEHRAVVSLPTLRRLHRAQVGDFTLAEVRRVRMGTGAAVPAWLGEALAGVLAVWVAVSCHEAVSRARRLA